MKRNWRKLRRSGVVFLFWLSLLPVGDLAAQRSSGEQGFNPPAPVTNVIIRVRTVRGTPLSGYAIVRLTARAGPFDQTASTREGGEAIFSNVMVGNYIAEVTSPGYLTAQEDIFVTLTGNGMTVVVSLIPEPEPGTKPTPSELPVLAPKAQAEIDKAVEAMRKNDPQEARKRLEKAAKMAPGHPDIYYLYGLLYLQMNDPRQAKANFEKAVAFYPKHTRALTALGDMLSREGDYPGAVRVLEKSAEYDSDSWQTQGLLANALYQEKQYEKARPYAQRALELSRGKSPEVRLLLAQILMALGEKEQARPQLEAILQEAPSHPSAAAARKLLEPAPAASPAATVPPPPPAPAIPVPRPEPPARAWAPPDIDEVQPAVTNDVPCSLPDVLDRASRRARTLVSSLERITATEIIEHAILNESGKVIDLETRDFNYVVTFSQYRPGTLAVEEKRSGRTSEYDFRSNLAALGHAAMALVFHPFYAPSYEMRCEGLGHWNGQPAWVVHFQQRPDVLNRFRAHRTTQGVSFEIKLKGRAWLATNTGDVLRMETDMMEPLVKARLTRDHLDIEYAPVRFQKDNTKLWLPSRVELYREIGGKRYRIRHTLRDFMLFSVDVSSKEEAPNEESKPPR